MVLLLMSGNVHTRLRHLTYDDFDFRSFPSSAGACRGVCHEQIGRVECQGGLGCRRWPVIVLMLLAWAVFAVATFQRL